MSDLFEKNPEAYTYKGPLKRITFQNRNRFPKDQYFLKGGILISWFYAVMKLRGKALHVAVELQFQCGLKQTSETIFSCSQMLSAGVSRDSALRAINVLEKNGFITTERKPGRKIIVKLMPILKSKETTNIT